MIVVLFGPPASGKGSQAKALARDLNFKHVATGDLCRQAIQSGNELGLQIKEIVEGGQLPSDEIIYLLLEQALQSTESQDLVLDGIPRTHKQAIDLDQILALKQRKVDVVIELVIEPNEIIARVKGRYSCKTCGAPYNVTVKRPRKEGICDVCGGEEFVRRADDSEEVMQERLKVYEKMTKPVREFYERQGKLRVVDASQSIETIQNQIETIIRDCLSTVNVKEN